MFVFPKIWHALFSWNTRFEIHPFALLPSNWQKRSHDNSRNLRNTRVLSTLKTEKNFFWLQSAKNKYINKHQRKYIMLVNQYLFKVNRKGTTATSTDFDLVCILLTQSRSLLTRLSLFHWHLFFCSNKKRYMAIDILIEYTISVFSVCPVKYL